MTDEEQVRASLVKIQEMQARVVLALAEPHEPGVHDADIAAFTLAHLLGVIVTAEIERPIIHACAAVLLATSDDELPELISAPDGSVFLGEPIFHAGNVPANIARHAKRAKLSASRTSERKHTAARRRPRHLGGR